MEQIETARKNLVGPVVRRLRMEAGWSQERLAAKLQLAGWDLSRAGLSKIEARLRRVNDAEVLVLARVLGCDIRDLYPQRPAGISKIVRSGAG